VVEDLRRAVLTDTDLGNLVFEQVVVEEVHVEELLHGLLVIGDVVSCRRSAEESSPAFRLGTLVIVEEEVVDGVSKVKARLALLLLFVVLFLFRLLLFLFLRFFHFLS